ncbi:MAG TPA: hypothetical protein VNF68_01235 [Candidatus Baltobacteraceae bacterium]|nr:hypothetical protein [Candidatus Baltobacteraceae bacterium]
MIKEIEILGLDMRAIEMGRLLTEAGFSVRSSGGTSPRRVDDVLVQIGKIGDQSATFDAMEDRFPLLQVGLCCWLLGAGR